jgi:transposase-like protein
VTIRRGREFYAALLREVEGGSPVSAVAQRHGVRARTLSWWCWKLRKDAATRPRKQHRKPTLVPVVVRGADSERRELLELSVGGCQLAFESGTDPAYVAALVRALARSC